jgi:hypothetical protein
MRKPSAIALEAAGEIMQSASRDVLFRLDAGASPAELKLKRWERNILTKERNRIARIVDAAIKTVKETP